MVVRIGHLADCALRHSCNLSSGVHDSGYVPDMLRFLCLRWNFEVYAVDRVSVRCHSRCRFRRSQRSMEEDVLLFGGSFFTPWVASFLIHRLCTGGIDVVLPVR